MNKAVVVCGSLFIILHSSFCIARAEPLLVYFSASWCPHCRQMKPTVQEVVDMGYPVLHVDVDKNQSLVQALKVETIPAVVVWERNSNIIKAKHEGKLTANQLRTYALSKGVRPTKASAER